MAKQIEDLSLSLLVFYVTSTILQLYMWRHICAGRLKKLDLRSGSQRHRHFLGFFNVPVLHRHGTTLFIGWFRHTAPFSCLLWHTGDTQIEEKWRWIHLEIYCLQVYVYQDGLFTAIYINVAFSLTVQTMTNSEQGIEKAVSVALLWIIGSKSERPMCVDNAINTIQKHSGSIPRNVCVVFEIKPCVTTKKVWLPDIQTPDKAIPMFRYAS